MTIKYLTSYENSTEYKEYDYYTPFYSPCGYCNKHDVALSLERQRLTEKQRKAVMDNQKQREYSTTEKHPNSLFNLLGYKLSKKVKELWRETDTVERSYFDNGTMISKSSKATRVF